LKDARDVLHDVPIPETDHSVPVASNFQAPGRIGVIPKPVLSAIYLDR
jgi:hypothetical protein